MIYWIKWQTRAGDRAPGFHGENRPVYQAGHLGIMSCAQYQLHRRGTAEVGGVRRIETGRLRKKHLLLQIKIIVSTSVLSRNSFFTS